MHTTGPLLVLAGAGSGKTRVVTNRIGYLLEKKACTPKNILAITFTNKAASEMQSRLKHLLGAKAEEMTVCTSHSLGNRILREFGKEIGIPPNFKIVTENDRFAILRAKLRETAARSETADLSWLLSRISLAKNKGLPPSAYPLDVEKGSLVKRVYTAYEKSLNKITGLDFDDLLLRSFQLLSEQEAVVKKLRERYKFISIDEYQDTNRIQFETVRLLAAPKNNLCAVGDDDQGIYGWRGADISNILSFNQSFPGTTVIKLERNYRSTSTILSAANAVIEKNERRTPKAMWSKNGDGDRIEHYQGEDEQDEAEWLGKMVASLNGSEGYAYKEIAVLVRTNELTRIYEEELRRRKIPFKASGGGGFYARKEVKDLFAYLLFILNPLDEMALGRLVKVPPWHLTKDTLKSLEEKAGRNKWPLWQAYEAYDQLLLSDTQKQILARLTHFIRHYRDVFKKGALIKPFRDMVAELKYREYIGEAYGTRKEEVEKRLAVVSELEHGMELFEKQRKRHDLGTYLQEIQMMLEEKEEEDNRNAISLLTLHSSKGMEFPVVFLPGLDDDILPSKRTVMEGGLEEERRLFYVGITRARKRLFFSWPSTRFLYNKHRPVNPCRFIGDIPETLLAAPIGKREAENREAVLADFFKQMREKHSPVNTAQPQN